MTVKEIKRKRSKSHSALIARILAALTEARENQYTAVTITLMGKDQNISDFFLVPGTDINAVVGLVETLKDEIKDLQYEQD